VGDVPVAMMMVTKFFVVVMLIMMIMVTMVSRMEARVAGPMVVVVI
jgi:hypothetical protein